jgi:hypothetical protein
VAQTLKSTPTRLLKSCISPSQVSYTYDPSTNSGVITVPTDPTSNGVLCDPFYVTAASWKYTSNNTWPQNLDVVHKLGKISTSGTYDFGAAVTCGQGDIYASYDANDQTLSPTKLLTGPDANFVETFLDEMGFTGPSPTYFPQDADCWSPLTPETGTPTVATATCAVPNGNLVTLPAVPGGIWSGTVDDSAPMTLAINTGYSGHPVDLGGFGTYTFTLTDGDAHDTYRVTGTTTTWTPVDVSTACVIPGDPDFAPQSCVSDQLVGGSITVGLKPGVLVYSIKGGPNDVDIENVTNATTTGLAPGDYVVSVTTAPGFLLDLSGQTTWPVRISIDAYAGDCAQLPSHPLYHADASGTDAVCVPSLGENLGTITLAHSFDGESEAGKVKYTITDNATGLTTNEATTVDSVQVPAGDYTVQGVLVDPTDGIDVPNTFTIHIGAATGDCQLDTFALFNAGATFAPATCRGSDGTSGTITFVTTAGEVDYTITNLATQVTTDLGTTTSSLKVAAGSYSIAAKVVHTGDTISEFSAASGTLPTITVAAVTTICSTLQTLAFTGVTSPGLGIALAGSMLILGLAGLFVRRRYGRSAK